MSSHIKEAVYLAFKNRIDVHTLIMVVGQACSLRCRDCANLCPYMPKSVASYDSDKVITELKDVLENIDSLKKFQIQGGEPFLYKDIDKVLSYVKNEKKISYCIIATNGTIIPREQTLRILEDNKFDVRISHYGVSNDRAAELSEILKTHNIRYRIFTFDSFQDKWANTGKEIKRDEDTRRTKRKFKNCAFRYCLTLENGYLAWCSRAINAPLVQKFKPMKNDCFKIEHGGGIKEKAWMVAGQA